jgi:hypothetical protein
MKNCCGGLVCHPNKPGVLDIEGTCREKNAIKSEKFVAGFYYIRRVVVMDSNAYLKKIWPEVCPEYVIIKLFN